MKLWKQADTSKVVLFYMVNSTDHSTEETGLTVTVTISKNGAAFAAAAGTPAEVGNGIYKLTPLIADLATVGPTVFRATATGADPCVVEGRVVTFDPYDTAWPQLMLSAGQIISGTASGTPDTVTMAASTLSSTADNHWNGRIIIWTSGTLAGQATDITAYVDSTRTFTFTAVTTGATAGDTFVIV